MKTIPRISRIRNIPLTWILARVFVYFPPFISQILDFIYSTVVIFILIYFEWRDTENQQLRLKLPIRFENFVDVAWRSPSDALGGRRSWPHCQGPHRPCRLRWSSHASIRPTLEGRGGKLVTLILTKRNTSSSRCNVPLDGVAFSRLNCLLLKGLLRWGCTFSDFCEKVKRL